jgi:hypothetical protein
MQTILLNIVFTVGRWILGWLWKMLRPILRSLLDTLWPVIRVALVVIGLLAAIVILRQVIGRRVRLAERA